MPAALLSLLARAADEQPVLAVVDDAQWLDEPSLEAFLFAGRRLDQEGVAMLARGPRRRAPDRGAVAGAAARSSRSPTTEARALLDAAIAPGVADRLMATAAGNPLALLEIPGLLSPAQLAGREPLEDPLRPGTGVERAFAAAVEALPAARPAARAAGRRRAPGTRRLGRDRAAGSRHAGPRRCATSSPPRRPGSSRSADGELEFRHPLMRSTVYHAASLPERRAAHAALADAADGAERAWHLAACAVAPDETRRRRARARRAGRPRPRRPRDRRARPRPRRPAHARSRSRARAACSPRPTTPSAAARPSARAACSTRRPR